VTLTADLQAAAQALVSRLQMQGCTTAIFDECSAFQTAYNNAGGAITLDGKYGPQTQAALQTVLTTLDGSTAPANCFGTTGGNSSIVPALTPTTPAGSSGPLAPISSFFAPGVTTTLPVVGPVQNRTLLVGAAGLFALWLVGHHLWKALEGGGHNVASSRKKVRTPAAYAKTERMSRSELPTRAYRRANPSKKRSLKKKSRDRIAVQNRDPKTGRIRPGFKKSEGDE
jgi:hypothetical protein